LLGFLSSSKTTCSRDRAFRDLSLERQFLISLLGKNRSGEGQIGKHTVVGKTVQGKRKQEICLTEIAAVLLACQATCPPFLVQGRHQVESSFLPTAWNTPTSVTFRLGFFFS